MKMERNNNRELTPEEHAHLEKLKTLVQECIANGRLSHDDLDKINTLINADNKVTYEELMTVRTTLREALGGAFLEYDWQ